MLEPVQMRWLDHSPSIYMAMVVQNKTIQVYTENLPK